MFGLFRCNKLYVPLITILGSAGLFLSYSFFYVSWQQNYANERAFRLLSVVGDQLNKRFENLQSVMAAALVYSSDGKPGKPGRRNPSQYLKEVAGYGDQISVVDSMGPCPEPWKREGDMKLRLLNDPGAFSLRAEFQASYAGKPKPCFIKAEVNPAVELRERFHNLTADYFDDILIATSTGEVLFESNISGLRISNLDTLVTLQSANTSTSSKQEGSKTNAFRDASQFSNVKEVKLAGSVYKLYVQPAPLRITVSGNDKQYVKTLVCGLWRIDRQQSELVSIPYATLIWGALVALAIFGTVWPLLKVAYMSLTERLKRIHVFYLLSSGMFVTGILTVLVLNGAYTVRADDESREQLDSLATQIDENVRAELVRALVLMNGLESDQHVHDLMRKATRENWTSARFLESPFFERLTPASYPYFDNVFWTDDQGRQLFKLTVRGEATPQTPVPDSTYFRYVRDEQHLKTLGEIKLPASLKVPLPLPDTRFRFEPHYSPNTGEYVVVLAKPSNPAGRGDLPKHFEHLTAQVLVTKFISLVDPSLPEGYGFAVVDHDGLVQFHSSEGRNQIENFFKESRDNAVLKALVMNGTSDFANVDYNGKQQLMRVMPLPYIADPALTLVVFRNTNYFNNINVACMLVFGLLAGLFSLPFLIGLAVYVIQAGPYPLERLWPSPAHTGIYIRMIAANVCLAAAFLMRFPAMEVSEILAAAAAVAVAAALFAITGSTRIRQVFSVGTAAVLIGIVVAKWSWALMPALTYVALSGPWASRWPTRFVSSVRGVKILYLAAAFSLLTVLVVLPCFGLFKISYNSVNRLDLETALRDRLDLLTHRAEELREAFARLQTAPGERTKPPSEALVRILERRIGETLDRYDNAIFWPSDAGRTKTSDLHVTALEKGIAWATGWLPNSSPGAKLRETAMAETAKKAEPWQHGQTGDDEVIEMKGNFQGIGEEDALRGVYPMWQLPSQAAILMGGLAILLLVWLSYMIRKMFLTGLAQVPPLASWEIGREQVERNLLIIGHPKSGRSTRAGKLDAKDWIDLAQVITCGNWTLGELPHPTVVVDTFEFDIDNPDNCLAKLKLLEDLVYVRKKHVILLSTVDPMFYVAESSPEIVTPRGQAPEPAAQILDRWAAVLSSFVKFEMEDLSTDCIDICVAGLKGKGKPCPDELVRLVHQECDHTAQLSKLGCTILECYCSKAGVSRADVIEELLDRADAYYRVLWSTCTRQERLVLFQLARDGWANPKNERAIQQLERRRLVTRSPGLRIMNESFRRFVDNAQLPSEVAKWEEEVQNSTWSALKLGFTTAALAAGAWLLYTQQDLFQVGLGYIAAMGTASGAVVGLIRNVTRTKTGGAAEKLG